MNREEALSIWAPEDSPWSPWTKPVLFSFMSDQIDEVPPSNGHTQIVPLLQDVALVVELAGRSGVEVGISLARSGYRPIPLYNACPYGLDVSDSGSLPSVLSVPKSFSSTFSVIDVVPIMRALERETSTLKAIGLKSSAPPAFLLDANRRNAGFNPEMGWFDNRSIIRESDLPTVAFLKQNGIGKVIVIRASNDLQSDLQTVLLSWQDAGLAIAKQSSGASWSPLEFAVPRPSVLKLWWNKFLLRFGYRLNSSGSFGRFVQSSGGSGG
jgi:hypothetical protein